MLGNTAFALQVVIIVQRPLAYAVYASHLLTENRYLGREPLVFVFESTIFDTQYCTREVTVKLLF